MERLFLIGAAALFVLVAVVWFSPRSEVGQALDESFANPSSELWGQRITAEAEQWIGDGEYQFLVNMPRVEAQSFCRSCRFDDFRAEAVGEFVSASGQDAFGLVFRVADLQNYYQAWIRADEMFRFDKVVQGELTAIQPWTAINSGILTEGPNRLVVGAAGEEFEFLLNGATILLIADDAFRSGYLGLAARSADAAGLHVAFDSLTVRAIE